MRSVRLQSMGNLTASQVRSADFQSKSKFMKAVEVSSLQRREKLILQKIKDLDLR